MARHGLARLAWRRKAALSPSPDVGPGGLSGVFDVVLG